MGRQRVCLELHPGRRIRRRTAALEVDHLPVAGSMFVDRVDPSSDPSLLAEAEVEGDLDQDRPLRGEARLFEDRIRIGPRQSRRHRLDGGDVVGVCGGLLQRHLAPMV